MYIRTLTNDNIHMERGLRPPPYNRSATDNDGSPRTIDDIHINDEESEFLDVPVDRNVPPQQDRDRYSGAQAAVLGRVFQNEPLVQYALQSRSGRLGYHSATVGFRDIPQQRSVQVTRAAVFGNIVDDEPQYYSTPQRPSGIPRFHSASVGARDLPLRHTIQSTGAAVFGNMFDDEPQYYSTAQRPSGIPRFHCASVGSRDLPLRHTIQSTEAAVFGNMFDDEPQYYSTPQRPSGIPRFHSASVGSRDETLRHTIQSITDIAEYAVNDDERRIVLLGKTGVGKSASGNTILGKDCFECKTSSNSVTKHCSKKTATRFGKTALVVDTPGLFDTNMNHEVVFCEIAKCTAITSPGPHAFIIVVRIGRFTEEDRKTVRVFVECFGERLFEFAIVLFTRTDDLESNQKLSDYVKDIEDKSLKYILQKCNNRYIGFNNRADESTKHHDAEDFFVAIEHIFRTNDKFCFINRIYITAETELQLWMKQLKEKYDKDKEEKIQEMNDEFSRKYQRKYEEYKAVTDQEIHDLRQTLGNLEERDEIRTIEERFRKIKRTMNSKKRTIEKQHQIQTCANNLREKVRDVSEKTGFLSHTLDGVRLFGRTILSKVRAIFT